jgi:16S rRNA (adenine1518-N6/adenine1519-N6)-dimethyltransferase
VSSHAPKKRFGQHFLHERAVVDRIVRTMDPKPGEKIVEIGPGLGALTGPLLEKCGTLTAIEIDRDVLPALDAAFGGKLDLIQGDALEVDFRELADEIQGAGKLRLAGNLPYNISTPLLFHLLESADLIADMHFMLQKEVVDRICAAPDTEDYGRLTVTLAARAEAHMLFTVGPGAFTPPPQVDSAVVKIVPRAPDFEIRDLAAYDRVVKAAFGLRRKTLSNALKGVATVAQIEAAGIDPRARGETLSPEEFARLANGLS